MVIQITYSIKTYGAGPKLETLGMPETNGAKEDVRLFI